MTLPVALRVLTSTGSVLYFLHGDHLSLCSGQALGSTSLVTSITGTLVARQLDYPYGAPRPGGSGALPDDR